jgi:hypothetical protein
MRMIGSLLGGVTTGRGKESGVDVPGLPVWQAPQPPWTLGEAVHEGPPEAETPLQPDDSSFGDPGGSRRANDSGPG